MANRLEAIANRLTELGFSQYEARTYLGLLTTESATGYSVANATGVPQPKVYETLRRLVERGAAVRTGDNPGRYSAVAPDMLLGGLENDFAGRVEAVRRDLETLPSRTGVPELVSVHRIESFPAAVERASQAIAAPTGTAVASPVAPRTVTFSSSARRLLGSFSTNSAEPAPRDSASRPSAPEPE